VFALSIPPRPVYHLRGASGQVLGLAVKRKRLRFPNRKNNMKAFAFAILLAGFAVAAPTGAPDEPKKDDFDRFQGTWTTIAVEFDGEKVPSDQIGMVKTRFKDKTYSQSLAGKEVETGGFSIDSSKDPKTIDMKILTGNDAGKNQPGIYKFEGEQLILCVAQPGSEMRPKSFETKGTGNAMITSKLDKQ
jgi:uncharacterized protein (TIGR03067 family)